MGGKPPEPGPEPEGEDPEGREIETVTIALASFRAALLSSLLVGTAAGLAMGAFLTGSAGLLRGSGLALLAGVAVGWFGRR